jgi:topoisomerase IV subunit A
VAPAPLAPGRDQVAALSAAGKLLVFPLADMRTLGSGRGVIVMGLDASDRMLAVGVFPPDRVVVRGTNRNGREVLQTLEGEALARHVMHRARKGAKLVQKLKLTGFGA